MPPARAGGIRDITDRLRRCLDRRADRAHVGARAEAVPAIREGDGDRLSRQGRSEPRARLHWRPCSGEGQHAIAGVVARRQEGDLSEGRLCSPPAEHAALQLGSQHRVSLHGRLSAAVEGRQAGGDRDGRGLLHRHHGPRRIEQGARVPRRRKRPCLRAQLVTGWAMDRVRLRQLFRGPSPDPGENHDGSPRWERRWDLTGDTPHSGFRASRRTARASSIGSGARRTTGFASSTWRIAR